MADLQDIKRFAKNNLPPSLIRLFRKILDKYGDSSDKRSYSSVTLTDEEIEKGMYKECLGGGSEGWESRGAFQLFFLQKMGMDKNSKLLDVGCGPGRAAKYLIEFLEDENYYGIDYNPDFIKAAEAMSKRYKLDTKNPRFEVVHDFNFENIEPDFDYAMVFSVLNHCDFEQKAAFFKMIPKPLKAGGKVYITHALWFDQTYIKKSEIIMTNQFGSNDFDIIKYGWKNKEEIFPIIELTKNY